MKQFRDTHYLATECGKIYNQKTGNLLKPHKNKFGYLQITLNVNPKLHVKIHRIVAEVYLGFSNLEVNHIDGNKLNNHYTNLEWCTRSENVKHAYDNNLIIREKGEDSAKSKLTETEVLSIRAEYGISNITYVKLASKYNVSIATIKKVIKKETWKHI